MPTVCEPAELSVRYPLSAAGRIALRATLLAVLLLTTGCAALHPIKGIPASYLPPEFLGPTRDGLRPINPILLTRSRPSEHLIDAGDVLTVYIPGVLGPVSSDLHTIGEAPPINYPQDMEMPPTIGFPISVRGDGTISLPQVGAIPVRGMTLAQSEEAVRQAYMHPRQILPQGKERVLVSLQRPREYRVLVVREDTGFTTDSAGVGNINLGNARRGTARTVSLKAYENDVLHALARGSGADGLPGLDAEGAVYVIRRRAHNEAVDGGNWQGGGMQPSYPAGGPSFPYSPAPANGTVIRYQSPSAGDYAASAQRFSGHSLTGASMTTPAMQGRPGYMQPQYGQSPPSQPQYGEIQYGQPQFYGTGPVAQGSLGVPTQHSAAVTGAVYSQSPGNQPSVHQTFIGDTIDQPDQFADAQPATWAPVLQSAAAPVQLMSGHGMAQPYSPPLAPPVAASPMMLPNSGPQAGYHAPHAGYAPQQGLTPIPQPEFSMGVGPHDGYFQSMMDSGLTGTIDDPHVVRIPIRIQPGEVPSVRECDVTLEDGDIVFIEARDSEVFYTGGLLGGGQITLPRDHDLRALEAISIAQSQGSRGGNVRSAGGVSAINQDVTISASKLIVVRKLSDGTTVPIEVDLNRAKRDMTGRENIVIQPGDFLYLQYSCVEAVGAFFERHLLEGALFGVAAAQFQTNGR